MEDISFRKCSETSFGVVSPVSCSPSEEATTRPAHVAAQAPLYPSPQHLLKAGHRKQKQSQDPQRYVGKRQPIARI